MPATCRANPLWLVAASAVLVMPAPSQREKAARIVAHFKRQAAPSRSRLAARIAPRPTAAQAKEKINALTSGVSGARVRVNQPPTVKLYFRAQSDVTHNRTRICCATRTAGRSTRRGRSRELFLT